MACLDALWGISPGWLCFWEGGAEAGEAGGLGGSQELPPRVKECRFHPPQVGRPYVFSGGPTWSDLCFRTIAFSGLEPQRPVRRLRIEAIEMVGTRTLSVSRPIACP